MARRYFILSTTEFCRIASSLARQGIHSRQSGSVFWLASNQRHMIATLSRLRRWSKIEEKGGKPQTSGKAPFAIPTVQALPCRFRYSRFREYSSMLLMVTPERSRAKAKCRTRPSGYPNDRQDPVSRAVAVTCRVLRTHRRLCLHSLHRSENRTQQRLRQNPPRNPDITRAEPRPGSEQTGRRPGRHLE